MAFRLDRFIGARQAAWWTLAAGLAVTGVVGWVMHREAVQMDRQRLAVRMAEVTAQLDARLEKSEMLLHNLRDYLVFSGEDRPMVFEKWCYENGLSINCPWLHGILVATNRSRVQWRPQLPPDPQSWTEENWETLRRLAWEHPIECDVALTSEVRDQKQFLPDYDLKASTASLDNRTRPSGWVSGEGDWLGFTIRLSSRLGMSERRVVMLDSKSNGITGTLIYVPIHDAAFAGLMTDELIFKKARNYARWLDFESLIVAPVDFHVLTQSIWDGAAGDLGVEIFSSTNQTADTWMNHSKDPPHAADPEFKAYLTHRQTWPLYGLKFSIFFYTTPLFEAQSPRRLAKIAMIAGTVLTLLASALVGVAVRGRDRQKALAEQIRDARDALAAAQQERAQLSRDLHDGTIQSLYAIQLGLGHTGQKLEADPSSARREFSTARRELDAVIAEIRQFITAETRAGGRVEFNTVLEAVVARVQNGTTAHIDSHCDPAASGRLTGNQAVQLANIAREALSNSLRHAQPRRVEVRLYSDRDSVILEITDDGKGFDPSAPGQSGVGLASMSARAQELGGKVDIQSATGKGTCVEIRVPAAAPEPGDAESPEDSTGRT